MALTQEEIGRLRLDFIDILQSALGINMGVQLYAGLQTKTTEELQKIHTIYQNKFKSLGQVIEEIEDKGVKGLYKEIIEIDIPKRIEEIETLVKNPNSAKLMLLSANIQVLHNTYSALDLSIKKYNAKIREQE